MKTFQFILGIAFGCGLVLAGHGAELIFNGGLEQLEVNGYPAGWKKFCEDPLSVDMGSLQQKGNPANP